jgi:hypothetical protein
LGREESKWWEGRTSRVGGIFISERDTHKKTYNKRLERKKKEKTQLKGRLA